MPIIVLVDIISLRFLDVSTKVSYDPLGGLREKAADARSTKIALFTWSGRAKKNRAYDVTKRFSFQDWKDNLNVGSKIEAGLYV